VKNKLMSLGGALALLAILGHYFAKPLMAQVRAALVQNVDEPARNPFLIRLSGSSPGGNFIDVPPFTVPAGKRYVVEHYSAFCSVGSGGFLQAIQVSTDLPTSTPGIFNSGQAYAAGLFYAPAAWVASGDARMYAEQNSPIELEASGGSLASCIFTVFGYSVNLP
jgi:hypothetical protein